ncbi:class I SAM-dependent methyltransferase [Methanoregula sp.]|uniref:class I SAM-dependent methyltransferase n=1 Tax=Methanoregula sp. TaxID=2052170 RepID=UPI0025D7AE23|nr:class I SAM-dependent methyltransferase [Methanoregula sp.]
MNVNEDVKKFNIWSGTYEDSRLQYLYFDRIHKGVLNLVNGVSAPVDLLDVGCGTGRLLRKIRERWPHAQLIGIDPAEGMVKKARQMMPDSTFMVSPAESIPLPDISVDLVFSTTSFHHWSDQLQGIREIRRVLRPGGQFFLADIAPLPFVLRFVHRGHGQLRNQNEVRNMFEQAGLEVQAQRRLFLGHILVTSGIRH